MRVLVSWLAIAVGSGCSLIVEERTRCDVDDDFCAEGCVCRGGGCVPSSTDADADVDTDADGDLDGGTDADADGDGCEPHEEVCNGRDDDCDGEIDEDDDCVAGESATCATTCGTEGTRLCEATCRWSDHCTPPAESCNGVDDDCDGEVPRDELDADEDGLRPCDGDCNDQDPVVGFCDCLAVAGGGLPIRIYRLDGLGGLTLAWTSDEAGTTRALAWIDVDGDGRQDLAAANEGDRNRIYMRTDSGFEIGWESDHLEDTRSMAWADWDGDEDVDPVFGSFAQPNRLFRNTEGVLNEEWTFGDREGTVAVLWADLDGDDDLDLVEANHRSICVLEADAGSFSPGWTSTDHDDLTTAAVASVPWEPSPMIFVGTQTGLFAYRREGDGYLESTVDAEMSWVEAMRIGDFDADGESELVAARSHEQQDVILENAIGVWASVWASDVVEDSFGVDMVDIDRDGVLEVSFDDTIYSRGDASYDVTWTPDEWNNTRSIAWGDCGDDFGE